MKSIITGITGQTGSYLAEKLLERGDEVYGMIRRSSSFNTSKISHIYNHPKLKLVFGDLSDSLSITSLIGDVKPDVFFHLAAQSHVKVSFDIPEYTFDINATGTMRCLESLRKIKPDCKFLCAATSELFGSSPPPQNENTKFHPRSPYSAAKIAAYFATVNYREAYNMHSSNTISYNHESPRRGETFITRKVTRAATRIKLGLQDELVVGNTDAKRDWIHAKDVVEAMLLVTSADKADDYVVSSGKSRSVQDLIQFTFDSLDLDWKKYIRVDSKYFRPSEVDHLCGDSEKINKALGWKPLISFEEMIKEMIESDLDLAKKEMSNA